MSSTKAKAGASTDPPEYEDLRIDDEGDTGFNIQSKWAYPISLLMKGKKRPTTAQFTAAFNQFIKDVQHEMTNPGTAIPGCADFSEPGVGKSITMAAYAAMHFYLWVAYMHGNSTVKVFDQIVVVPANKSIMLQLREQFMDVFSQGSEEADLINSYVQFVEIGNFFSHINSLDERDRVCVIWDEIHTRINQLGEWKGFREQESDADLSKTEVGAYINQVTEDPSSNRIRATRISTATPVQNKAVEMNSIMEFLNRFERLKPRFRIKEDDSDEVSSEKIIAAFRRYEFKVVFLPSPVKGVLFARPSRGISFEKLRNFEFTSDELTPLIPDKDYKVDDFGPVEVSYSKAQEDLYPEYEGRFTADVNPLEKQYNTMLTIVDSDIKISSTKKNRRSIDISPKFSVLILEFLTRGCRAMLVHMSDVRALEKKEVINFFRHNDLVHRFKKWKQFNEDLPDEELLEEGEKFSGFEILNPRNFDASSDTWNTDLMKQRNQESGDVFYLQLSSEYSSTGLVNWAQTAIEEDTPILVIISDRYSYGLNFGKIGNLALTSPEWQNSNVVQIMYRILRMDSMSQTPKRILFLMSVKKGGKTADQKMYATSFKKYKLSDQIIQNSIMSPGCLTRELLPEIPRTIVHPMLEVSQGSLWKKVQSQAFFPIIDAIELAVPGYGKDELLAFYTVWLSFLGIHPSVFKTSFMSTDEKVNAFRSNIVVVGAYYLMTQRQTALKKALRAAKS